MANAQTPKPVINATAEPKLWHPFRISPRTGTQHLDLSGRWELSYLDQPITDLKQLDSRKDAFQTTVPNSIHWSLYKAGKLPHPYYNLNSKKYYWTDEKVWYYQRSFDIPASAAGNQVFLCFDGIDYFAKVWVNDKLVGVHEGMFGGPNADITKFIKPGKNQITVEVRAGNWGNKAEPIENLPRKSTGEIDYSKRKGYQPRASGKIIKPWLISGGSGGEAFFSVGMWQGVRLEIVPAEHLERPYLTTTSVANGQAQLHLSAEVFVKSNSLRHQLHPWHNTQLRHPDEKGVGYIPVTAKLAVQVEIQSAGKSALFKEIPLALLQGRNWLEYDFSLPDPKLWNPTGLGEPNLYQVKLTLKKNSTIIDQHAFDYGIRTIDRVPTAGPRLGDRWENWQFVVNGRKIFVKGMNFTPQDILLDTSPERYRWTLQAAKNMGVQLIRVWGGGLLETDTFYKICNELGMMVWQDFPIGNQETPDYPQDVWEAQIVHNIVRLRNHPSLVIYCGGNEFNPYAFGSAGSVGILERSLRTFDPSRLFVRTTPDHGAIHVYPDMDPIWYNRSYAQEPWISETGMHSVPEASLFYETVDKKEFNGLGKMWDKNFAASHPEFIHHFTEYGPGRVPRMLSRASHIADVTDPTIESIAEASQVGAGEFYQVMSEKVQGNYPVTAGLMPWVFKRHWPVIAIQMMDWFGQAAAPYYFLKRTYEPTHVAVDIPRLLWKAGEKMAITTKITPASEAALPGSSITVTIFDDTFKPLRTDTKPVTITAGPSVTTTSFEDYQIPDTYKDRFVFILTELKDASGRVVSRQNYFPRVLRMMEEPAFYTKYVNEPIAWLTLEKGPFLKPTVAATRTKVTLNTLSHQVTGTDLSTLTVAVKNEGSHPAFMSRVDVTGTKRAFVASDNYFWLAPGETRSLTMNLLWREPKTRQKAILTFSAWNADAQQVKITKAR